MFEPALPGRGATTARVWTPATTACPEMTVLAGLIRAFARGLDRDRDAANAALTCPYHNGGTG